MDSQLYKNFKTAEKIKINSKQNKILTMYGEIEEFNNHKIIG